MAVWLMRAGKHGEFENKFLEDERIYLTWDALFTDLSKVKMKKELPALLLKFYPDEKPATYSNWTGQIWPFAREVKIGDWVILPSKKKPALHIAEVTGNYIYDPDNPPLYQHYRNVKWFAMDIPRSNFDQDILYSLGAFMTFCRISRNDAEKRIKEMARNGWKPVKMPIIEPESGTEFSNLEYLAKDQIAKFLITKFKGHGMARLIEAILQAQGYSTYRSPEGPDKGIDILAAPGPLGFGSPRLCIQVKTGDTPVDRPTLDQLIGAMESVKA